MKKWTGISVMALLVAVSTAADSYWTGNGADNLWTTAGNWDSAPVAGSVIRIYSTNNNPVVNTDIATVYGSAWVASNSTATLTVEAGGYLRLGANNLWLGNPAASTGTLYMTGGTIESTADLTTQSGSSSVAMSGGALKFRRIYMGSWDGHGESTFTQSGGSVILSDWCGIGFQSGGMQTMTLTGGTFTANNLSVGLNDGVGTLNIGGTALLTLSSIGSNGRLRVGETSGGAQGTINLTGGTLTAGSSGVGYVSLGYSAGNVGTMTLSAGTLNTYSLVAGNAGTGAFTMTGGDAALYQFRLGEGSGSLGTAWISGGTLTATNHITLGHNVAASGKTNALYVSGGRVETAALTVGRYGNAYLALSGGELDVTSLLFDTNGGDGTLKISGSGVLKWLGGDYTANVNAFIAAGDITAANALSVTYDSGNNWTTVTLGTGSTWTGNGSDNNWTTAANWDVVPVHYSEIYIYTENNNPLINTELATPYSAVFVGSNSTATLTVEAGGYLRLGDNNLWLGDPTASTGMLYVTGGTIESTADLVTRRGSSTVAMSGGALKFRRIYMGSWDGHGESTFTQSGGSVTLSDWAGIGFQSGGMQTMTLSGGIFTALNLSVGLNDGQGTLNLTDNGHLLLNTGRLRVGETSGGGETGIINMLGGQIESPGSGSYIALGFAAGNEGVMTMTAGDIVLNAFVVGLNGYGAFDMSGGTITAYSLFRLGEGTGSGVWNMSGGLVVATNFVAAGWGAASDGSTNTVTMTGGEIRTGDLVLGRSGSGVFILSGGQVHVNAYGAGSYTNGLQFATDGGYGCLDITGEGELVWQGGNHIDSVNVFIADGRITSSAKDEELRVTYHAHENVTVVDVLQHKGTVILLQ